MPDALKTRCVEKFQPLLTISLLFSHLLHCRPAAKNLYSCHAICVVDHSGHEMKTFLPPKANPVRLGHAKYGDAVKLELGDAVWENPLIKPGTLANFNGYSTDTEFAVSTNRSISDSALRKIFLTLIIVCVMVAAFSFTQGNVLVPVFVIIDLAIVGGAILAVAQASNARDALIVDFDSKQLLVRTTRKRSTTQRAFSIAWVRLKIEDPISAPRIYLTASGNSVEIGSFLNHEQRVSLANQLTSFLELAKARALN